MTIISTKNADAVKSLNSASPKEHAVNNIFEHSQNLIKQSIGKELKNVSSIKW